MSISSSSSSPPIAAASELEIQRAIEYQIKLAEQCTAFRKKLYLVHRWQRQVLQKFKRASTIEPEGYKPIWCLYINKRKKKGIRVYSNKTKTN